MIHRYITKRIGMKKIMFEVATDYILLSDTHACLIERNLVDVSALEYSIFKRTRCRSRVGSNAGAVDRCTQGCFEFVPKMERIFKSNFKFQFSVPEFFRFFCFYSEFFSSLGKRSDDSSLFFIFYFI